MKYLSTDERISTAFPVWVYKLLNLKMYKGGGKRGGLVLYCAGAEVAFLLPLINVRPSIGQFPRDISKRAFEQEVSLLISLVWLQKGSRESKYYTCSKTHI